MDIAQPFGHPSVSVFYLFFLLFLDYGNVTAITKTNSRYICLKMHCVCLLLYVDYYTQTTPKIENTDRSDAASHQDTHTKMFIQANKNLLCLWMFATYIKNNDCAWLTS